MLNRRDEAAIFEQTADYLEERRRAAFHLVVDELHSYKGTAGTEVAMLLRRLLHRLGLELDSPKLRVLAASASLGDSRGRSRAYLEEFFGVDRAYVRRSSRAIPRDLGLAPDASAADETAAARARCRRQRDPCRRERTRSDAVLSVVGDAGRVRARASTRRRASSRRAADETDAGRARSRPRARRRDSTAGVRRASTRATLAGLLSVLAQRYRRPSDGESDLRAAGPRAPLLPHRPRLVGLRPRRLPGGAGRVPLADRARVGKLYAQPTIRCECGARCLDLWACETCGDHLLGGYASKDSVSGGWYLLPELPDLESVPDFAFADRTYARYRVFWPRPPERGRADGRPTGTRRRCQLPVDRGQPRHPAGRVAPNGGPDANGWLFTMQRQRRATSTLADVPAIPTRCPNCGDDREVRTQRRGSEIVAAEGHLDASGCARSLRRARATHDRVSQILAEHLLARRLPGRRAAARRLLRLAAGRRAPERVARRLAPPRRCPPARRPLPERTHATAPTSSARFQRRAREATRARPIVEFIREMRDRSEAARALLDGAGPSSRPRPTSSAPQELAGAELAGVGAGRRRPRLRLQRAAQRRPKPGRPVARAATVGRSCFDWNETPPRPRDPPARTSSRSAKGCSPRSERRSSRAAAATSSRSGLDVVQPRAGLVTPPADLPRGDRPARSSSARSACSACRASTPRRPRLSATPERNPPQGAAGLAEGGRGALGSRAGGAARLGARAPAARRPGLPALARAARPLPDRPAARGGLDLRALRLASRPRERRRLHALPLDRSRASRTASASDLDDYYAEMARERAPGHPSAHRGADRADRARGRGRPPGPLPRHLPRR